ncbi:MAG: hypothetical protein ACYS7Y_29565 [Planctomycetota bacterium]|jgi:hypothetical protein
MHNSEYEALEGIARNDAKWARDEAQRAELEAHTLQQVDPDSAKASQLANARNCAEALARSLDALAEQAAAVLAAREDYEHDLAMVIMMEEDDD